MENDYLLIEEFQFEIRNWRKVFSDQEIANLCDVTVTTVTRWVAGTSSPLPGMRRIILKWLSDAKNHQLVESEPPCPTCNRPYPEGWSRQLSEKRSKSIREAHAKVLARGGKLGRERIVNYEEIYKMKDQDIPLRTIATTLKISKGTVQWALKKRA